MRLIRVPIIIFCALFTGLAVLSCLCACPLSPGQDSQAQAELLQRILGLAENYCRRLNTASLYYVCREDVRDSHVATIERSSPWGPMTLDVSSRRRHWIYDYQLVRTPLGLSEVRTLLEEDGIKKNEPGARLETEAFDFKTVIFGPNGMFGPDNRGNFDFALLDEHTEEGEEVLAVKATPKKGVEVRVLYGTAWLRLRDGAALRVDWDQESMRNISVLQEETQVRGMVPILVFRSEYGFEKNGLRFPSRYSINLEWREPETQKHLDAPEAKIKRTAEIEVVYSDYKFFTVEVEVKQS